MKYKVGDKIKIKELDIYGDVLLKLLKENHYTLTITEVKSFPEYYRVKEIDYIWNGNEIECLAKDYGVQDYRLMKYKAGDKVRITDKYRYGLKNHITIGDRARRDIYNSCIDGVFTIKGEHPEWKHKPCTYYVAKEFATQYAWDERFIEMVEEFAINPVNDRFEILDL